MLEREPFAQFRDNTPDIISLLNDPAFAAILNDGECKRFDLSLQEPLTGSTNRPKPSTSINEDMKYILIQR